MLRFVNRKVNPFLTAAAVVWLLLGWPAAPLRAQQSIADSTLLLTMLQVSYGGYFPQADLGKRFGYANFIGMEVGPKFKSNWYALGGGSFIFGDEVRENQLLSQTSYSFTVTDPVTGRSSVYSGWLDRDGLDFVPTLSMRGFTGAIRVGKIIQQLRFKGLNPNSGPFIEAGVQGIQHWISISSPDNAPYLEGKYRKGYDRRTRGVGALFSVGYRIFSSNRFINGYVAFDVQRHWSQTLRYNFDERRHDDRIRNDLLIGFRVGWCFPIYRQSPEGYYYY